MASITAAELVASMTALSSRIVALEMNAGDIPSSVMSPADAPARASQIRDTLLVELGDRSQWSGEGSRIQL